MEHRLFKINCLKRKEIHKVYSRIKDGNSSMNWEGTKIKGFKAIEKNMKMKCRLNLKKLNENARFNQKLIRYLRFLLKVNKICNKA